MSCAFRYTGAFILMMVSLLPLSSQTVSNVTAEQVGKTIRISYDLDKQTDISVFVSTDGGITYTEIQHVSGDVGEKVKAGHKTLVWDVLIDRDSLADNDIVFKVKAKPINSFTKKGKNKLPNKHHYRLNYINGVRFQSYLCNGVYFGNRMIGFEMNLSMGARIYDYGYVGMKIGWNYDGDFNVPLQIDLRGYYPVGIKVHPFIEVSPGIEIIDMTYGMHFGAGVDVSRFSVSTGYCYRSEKHGMYINLGVKIGKMY